MGASFHTWSLRGALGAEATDRVADWLERRGFELDEGEILFDEPSDDERGVVIASDGRWTIATFDRRDEEERFAHELRALGAPMLESWVYDSDAWGYRLEVDGREVESFDSTEKERPSTEALCRIADRVGAEPEVRALLDDKRVFAERSLTRFLDRLGVLGAALDYWDWVATAEPNETRWKEYTVARMRFRRPGARVKLDLHAGNLPRRLPPLPTEPPAMPAEISMQFAFVRTLFLFVTIPLRILFFVLRPVFYLLFRARARRVREEAERRARVRYVVDGSTLRVPRHRLRLELPEQTEIEPFLFGHELLGVKTAGARASLRALRPERLRDFLVLPANAKLEDDTCYFAGDQPARSLAYSAEEPRGRGRGERFWHLRELVDAGPAIYELCIRSEVAIPEAARRRLRAMATSLRREEPAPAPSQRT
jgi:hypothetical protein